MALALAVQAISLRQNAAITLQHPKQSHQTYNSPPGSKTLDWLFAKPAPEVVAAANSLANTLAVASTVGSAAARTSDRKASTALSSGASRGSCGRSVHSARRGSSKQGSPSESTCQDVPGPFTR